MKSFLRSNRSSVSRLKSGLALLRRDCPKHTILPNLDVLCTSPQRPITERQAFAGAELGPKCPHRQEVGESFDHFSNWQNRIYKESCALSFL